MITLEEKMAELDKIRDLRDFLKGKLTIEEAKTNTSLFESIDATEKYLIALINS